MLTKGRAAGAHMSLAETLRDLRVRAGWTQLDLAKKTNGVTPATISRIESAQIENPQRDTLVQLAEALGVTIGVLVGESEAAPDPPIEELLRRAFLKKMPAADVDALLEHIALFVQLPPEKRQSIQYMTEYLGYEEGAARDGAKRTPKPPTGTDQGRGERGQS